MINLWRSYLYRLRQRPRNLLRIIAFALMPLMIGVFLFFMCWLMEGRPAWSQLLVIWRDWAKEPGELEMIIGGPWGAFSALFSLLVIDAIHGDAVGNRTIINTLSYGYTPRMYLWSQVILSLVLSYSLIAVGLGLGNIFVYFSAQQSLTIGFLLQLIINRTRFIFMGTGLILFASVLNLTTIQFSIRFFLTYIVMAYIVYYIGSIYPSLTYLEHFLPFDLGAKEPLLWFGYSADPWIGLMYLVGQVFWAQKLIETKEFK